MAKTKALKDPENAELRIVVQKVLDGPFEGGRGAQTRFSEATGISQAHVSNMLNSGRGGGIESLRALAKYRPVEVAKILGIRPETILALWSDEDASGVEVVGLPEHVRRAARAAVELWGCTPDEALQAAHAAMGEPTSDDDPRGAFEWLALIRGYLPKRQKSGTRRRAGQ